MTDTPMPARPAAETVRAGPAARPVVPAALEQVDCPLCQSGGGRIRHAGPGFKPYRVLHCAACGLDYLSPRPTEAAAQAAYASDAYFQAHSADAAGYVDYAAQAPALRATFARFLGQLARRGLTGGALLEVGCGHGFLLEAAQPHFERRVGTDYSAAAARIAALQADAVHVGGVEAVPPGEQFDCVIATHVIEHVYRPHAFVRALAARLKPGGTLVLAAPDAGSFWRVLMGRRWPSYKLPEHILYFNRHTLARLLREAGLESPAVVPYPHAFPLPLVAAKLGLPLPRWLGGHSLWLPRTTIALAATRGADAR